MYFSRHFLSIVNFHKGEIDDQFKETQSEVFIPQEPRVGNLRLGVGGSWQLRVAEVPGRRSFFPASGGRGLHGQRRGLLPN